MNTLNGLRQHIFKMLSITHHIFGHMARFVLLYTQTAIIYRADKEKDTIFGNGILVYCLLNSLQYSLY